MSSLNNQHIDQVETQKRTCKRVAWELLHIMTNLSLIYPSAALPIPQTTQTNINSFIRCKEWNIKLVRRSNRRTMESRVSTNLVF